MRTPLEALEHAIAIAGGQSALASKINASVYAPNRKVKQQNVSYWVTKAKRAGGDSCQAISDITKVPMHELRPDLYRSEAA